MALNSFGQSSPLMAFSENRSPSNGSGPDSGRKSNGLKSMPPTPPQMYTTDAPMANEEFTGTTTVNSSPTKIPLSGRSNDTKMGMNGRSNNSNAMIRRKGLPWVLCSMVCVIFLLLIMIAYLMFKIYGNDQIEYWSTIPPSSSPSPISSTSLISSSSPNKSPQSTLTTTASKFTTMATTTISPQKEEQSEPNLAPIWPKLDQKHESVEARFSKAAIASENALCSEIGRNVLLKGGNAIDAAISISICIGALNSHSSGLGGGFLMTYYQRFYGKCYSIDARETAPSRTDKNTFNSNPTDAKFGYKSVAIPGEIHGFWIAFKRFGSGRIAWMDLLMPTVNLLNEGFPASKLLETNLKYFEEKILNGTFPGMRNQYLNPLTGNLYKEGEIIRKPILANTLHRLALSHDPVQLFYSANGEIAKAIVEEFAPNGLINRKDLHMYRSVVDENPLLNTEADSKLVFCGPKPSSGFAVTQLILAIMLKFYPMKSNSTIPWNSEEFWHRLIEAEKFAYSLHAKLGDINFVKNSEQFAMEMTKEEFVEKIRQKIGQKAFNQSEYLMEKNAEIEPINEAGGTSQLLVIDVDGNAVSMTNSINKPFGSLILSPRLGIVWNNHMADFNLPNLSNNTEGFAAQSSTNFIEPGKRPMSSMSPMIAYDRETKKVKLAIGASGGPKISSAIAQVLIQMLSFGHGPKEAIDTRRIHNQFTPISTEFEAEFPKAILDALQNRGQQMIPMHFPFSYVQAIIMSDGESKDKGSGEFMIASNDGRRQIHSQPIGY